MTTMSVLSWDGQAYPEGLRPSVADVPVPGPGWALIRNRSSGICGSDLHYLSGAMVHQLPPENLPAVLGHENAGDVVAVGPGVDGFAVGDRVAAEPLHPCRAFGTDFCDACMAGDYHHCSALSFVGIPTNRVLTGGYGEYSLYHASCLFPLADHVSYEEAAFLDVLACGVHAAHVGQPGISDTVVVLGCGPIGLSTLLVLWSVGVRAIVAVAKYSFQADMARAMGARAVVCLEEQADALAEVRRLVGAADQVYECVGGHADTVNQAIALCRRGGRIIIGGFFVGESRVNMEKLFLDELSIHAATAYSLYRGKREFGTALDLIAEGQVDVKPLISHSYPRALWRDAFDAAFDREKSRGLKIMFAD